MYTFFLPTIVTTINTSNLLLVIGDTTETQQSPRWPSNEILPKQVCSQTYFKEPNISPDAFSSKGFLNNNKKKRQKKKDSNNNIISDGCDFSGLKVNSHSLSRQKITSNHVNN